MCRRRVAPDLERDRAAAGEGAGGGGEGAALDAAGRRHARCDYDHRYSNRNVLTRQRSVPASGNKNERMVPRGRFADASTLTGSNCGASRPLIVPDSSFRQAVPLISSIDRPLQPRSCSWLLKTLP
jgi:hypothetical protein